MTTPDMMEALQALAAEKGMTTELLLEAVANGLESAYKRMPEAADDAVAAAIEKPGEVGHGGGGIGGGVDADHRVAAAEGEAVEDRGRDALGIVGRVIRLDAHRQPAGQPHRRAEFRHHRALFGDGDEILVAADLRHRCR